MYPKVESTLGFSVTHKIVKKLGNKLETVVQEINDLAAIDPTDPHSFVATITLISLGCHPTKPYMLDVVTYEVSCILFVNSATGLVNFSDRTESLAYSLGDIVTLEEIYKSVRRLVWRIYADEVRLYKQRETK